MDDVALVDLARRDQNAGLAAIYERYGDRIHDYCRSILRNDADAADALHETFLAASARIEQLRDAAKLRPWLYAIARNFSNRTLRRRKRDQPRDDLEPVMTPTDAVDAAGLESNDAQRLVWEAATGLAAADRDVLDLHLRHGLDGAELADVLGVSPAQANQAMHRMRERLNRSVAATLALRYGRRDCPELKSIIGDEALNPLLRKRIARHIDSCGTCERYRSAGSMIFAAIPISIPSAVVGRQVLAGLTSSDRTEAFAAADRLQWTDTGFPAPPPDPPPVVNIQPESKSPSAMRIGVGGVAAAALLIVAFIGGRWLADDSNETRVEVAVPEPTQPSLVQPTVVAAPDTPGPAAPTDPPPSVETTSTTASIPASTSTIAPTTTVPETEPLPTVTFSNDFTAPSLGSLTIDCSSDVTITATVDDNEDDAPTAELDVSWISAPSPLPLLAAPQAPTYEVIIPLEDLSGLSGQVTFVVSGRLRDAAGNLADVTDSESCSFGIE